MPKEANDWPLHHFYAGVTHIHELVSGTFTRGDREGAKLSGQIRAWVVVLPPWASPAKQSLLLDNAQGDSGLVGEYNCIRSWSTTKKINIYFLYNNDHQTRCTTGYQTMLCQKDTYIELDIIL